MQVQLLKSVQDKLEPSLRMIVKVGQIRQMEVGRDRDRTLSADFSCSLYTVILISVTAGTNKNHLGTDHQRIAKLARDDEVAPPPKVAPSVGKAIGQARQAKNLTQKDLGTKINEKPQVIAEYESGVSMRQSWCYDKRQREKIKERMIVLSTQLGAR